MDTAFLITAFVTLFVVIDPIGMTDRKSVV